MKAFVRAAVVTTLVTTISISTFRIDLTSYMIATPKSLWSADQIFSKHNSTIESARAATAGAPSNSFLSIPSGDFKLATNVPEQSCDPSPYHPQKYVSSFPMNRSILVAGILETPLAICEYLYPDERIPGSKHFPHVMQNLYQCYAHWQSNPSLLPIVLTDNASGLMDIIETNPFLNGFFQLLQADMKVKVVTNSEIVKLLKSGKMITDEKETVHDKGEFNATKLRRLIPRQVTGYILDHVEKLNAAVGRELEPEEKIARSTKRNHSCTFPNIGILNRRGSSKRSITNTEQLLNQMDSEVLVRNITLCTLQQSGATNVSVYYFEEKTFLEQVHFFRGVDVLISPHGAQLTGIPFMANKPCTQLIEIFPHNYLLPRFFGSLAIDSGIGYSYLYASTSSIREVEKALEMGSGRVTANSRGGRQAARGVNFCVRPEILVNAVREAMKHWCECKQKFKLKNKSNS